MIPAVEAVDGKCRPSRQAVAPAFHAVRRLNGVLQAPGHHDGENGDAVLHALNDAAVRYVPPDAPLGSTDGFHLGIELRHEAEGHTQHQAQSRDDPPEEIHELI